MPMKNPAMNVSIGISSEIDNHAAAHLARDDFGGDGGVSALRSVSNGVNVGLCDGSVRFVDNKVNLDTWKLLSQRDDGQVEHLVSVAARR